MAVKLATVRNNAALTDERQKASGFLNFYLPRADGSRGKVGAIPLYENNARMAQLIAQLEQDPEAASRLVKALQVDYVSAIPKEGTEFVF